ncbi:unnamed protein product [Protopolystoma xenopodis]|uniref:Uncharacterized protein n=1 Tax=Protopolystoma xenopodis TaxID=117903 RepID=A0A3S5CKQ9_9PLAT|nr:unnamed protein product [Protopolystoma xenopodis]
MCFFLAAAKRLLAPFLAKQVAEAPVLMPILKSATVAAALSALLPLAKVAC